MRTAAVDLILSNGTRYSTGKPGETQTGTWTKDLTMALNPEDMFRRAELPRGINEKTISDLRKDGVTKLQGGLSPHPEIYSIQQKFSIPAACFVFAIIGLALGLTVSRDGKLGGFVIGVMVIFAYYMVMFLAEAQTKGHYRALEEARLLESASFLNAQLTRWWPNILLGAFGIAALVWRSRFSERQFPIGLSLGMPHLPARWSRSRVTGGRRRGRLLPLHGPARGGSSSCSACPVSGCPDRACSTGTSAGSIFGSSGSPSSRSWVSSTSRRSSTRPTRSSKARRAPAP